MFALRTCNRASSVRENALAARDPPGKAKSHSRPETRETQTHNSLSDRDVETTTTTFIYIFPLYQNARPIALFWPIFLGHFKADRRIGLDIEPCDCVIPLPAALHTAVIVIFIYTLFLGFLDSMLWFSSSSRDSLVRRAACGLSLLALLGSSGVGAQLNNETSPTHQFKSVGTALLCFAFRGLQ